MKTFFDLREAWETQKGIETKRKANTDVEEAAGKFTDKQIKMAYGIINDPRWKSGNMTAIVRKIEGIAKGLSKHSGVQKALQVTNEEVQIDEAAPKISTGKAKGSIKATGLRGKGMKKFDVDVSIKNGKFEFRISDESGKFQTVGLKQAASMLGESVEDLEAFALEETRKYTPPTKAEIEADKKKDNKGKPRPSVTAKSITKRLYGR